MQQASITSELLLDVSTTPFDLFSALFFFLAIVHALSTRYLAELADKLERKKSTKIDLGVFPRSFRIELVRFLSETEVVFGLWVIPQLIAMTYFYNWNHVLEFLDGLHFVEPLYVATVLIVILSRPIEEIIEQTFGALSRIDKGSCRIWWWLALTLGPLLGSVLKETSAMLISCAILADRFFTAKPSTRFKYVTFALLLVNVSLGGALTNFGSSSILMVRDTWGWTSSFVFNSFGIPVLLSIFTLNFIVYLFFRKELQKLELPISEYESGTPCQLWVKLAYVAILAWIIFHGNYPVVFIGTLVLFVGLHQAIFGKKEELKLRPGIMIGFFLAGLIIHGTLQEWWVSPLFRHCSEQGLFPLSVVLSAFNQNALVTYMALHVQAFNDLDKYYIVAGSLLGGGLTLFGNSPNFAAFSILRPFFPRGISLFKVFAIALCFVLIVSGFFLSI